MKSLIYIIDDNIVSEFATRLVLEQSNIDCKVLSFEDSRQGLKALLTTLKERKEVPNIVLLDLKMPEIDGWAFLDEVSKRYKPTAIPAIYMVSNFNSSKIRKRAAEHRFLRGYIERPLSISAVENMLSPQL